MQSKFFNIGIAGNIGAGKTTFTEILAKEINIEPIYESVIDNPYLEPFYLDMDRWSFNLQIYFLYNRFKSQTGLLSKGKSFIQDRTIYEDKEIFARNLYELGKLSKTDWNTYRKLYEEIIKFVKSPDLIVYLNTSTDVLMSRIKNRKRDFEKEISAEYIHSLNIYYNKWINRLDPSQVLIVNTDEFNIFEHKHTLNEIIKYINQKINAIK